MQLEVEQKFPVADLAAVERQLRAWGAEIGSAGEEVDQYFAHPARDFSQTDEALRIRRKGDTTLITYKGPKIDQTTKTRREIELPLGSGEQAARQWGELLIALGFRHVAQVRKERRKCRVAREGFEVEICLDEVEGLGSFVELEVVVPDEQLDEARRVVAQLAQQLGLHHSERRSYLELLLACRRGR